MIEDYTVGLLFSFHIALLCVKSWAFSNVVKALALLESPNSEKYILVFKPFEMVLVSFLFVAVVAEIIFLVNFFVNMPLYYYEYISMADEIFFMYMTIRYFKQETKEIA